MRRQRQRISGDFGRLGAGGCEGLDVFAAYDAGLPPKRIGDDAQVNCRRRFVGVEGLAVIAGPGRHDQSPIWTQRFKQGGDQTDRTTFDRTYAAERGVDEQYAAGTDAQQAKLLDDFGSRQLPHGDVGLLRGRRAMLFVRALQFLRNGQGVTAFDLKAGHVIDRLSALENRYRRR